MGSLTELQKVIRQKEDKILELEEILKSRDTEIEELRSKLDKFQSVMPHGLWKASTVIAKQKGPRSKRGMGISAEPQALISVQEMVGKEFKKYPKEER